MRSLSERQEISHSVPLALQATPSRHAFLVFTLLCALVALLPLPLGSARPLAWEGMGLAVALLLGLSLRLPAGEIRAFRAALAVPAALVALVVGFVLVQLAPWTPALWHHPVWEVAGEALAGLAPGRIAADPPAALAALTRLLAYGGLFLLALLLCRAPARALAATRLIAFAGGAYAAYGLAAYGFGNGTLLWLRKWAYPGDLTATFVNHNSAATYFGLALLAGLAALVTVVERARFHGRRRERLAQAIELLSREGVLVVCLFLLATALFLTHSRGGAIAALAGVLALVLAVAQAPSLHRLRRLRLAALGLLLVGAAFLVSGDRLVERMVGAGADAEGRLALYRVAAQAIGDHPFLGSGLGAFEAVFPIYRAPGLWGHVDMAHDDYLQSALEFGLPAAGALLLALLWLAGLCALGVARRRRDAVFPCLGLAASVLVGVHALVDFSLQIPAVTATWLFLLGLGVAQSRSTRTEAGVTGGRPAPSGRPGAAPGRS